MRYAAVGHLTLDDFGGEIRIGGSVAYGCSFAAGLGLESLAVSRVGMDMPESHLNFLREQGVDVSRVRRSCEKTTRFLIRRGSGFTCPTLLASRCDDMMPDDLEGLEADVIHLGPVAGEVGRDVALKSTELSKVTLLDLQGVLREFTDSGVKLGRGSLDEFLSLGLVVHLNLAEALAATGAQDVIGALGVLSKQFKIVSISLGRGGAIFSFPDSLIIATSPEVNALDEVGAGDVLTAALGIALATGLGSEEAARFSVASASASTLIRGPGWVDRSMIEELERKVRIERMRA